MRFSSPQRLYGLLLFAASGFLLVSVPWKIASVHASRPGTWTAAMHNSRDRFSGVLLPSGKVLVAGSWSNFNGAEIYDPSQNTWTVTGNMITGRSEFQAALLSDGFVLAAGGAIGVFPNCRNRTL
jgi:hypothetical protein